MSVPLTLAGLLVAGCGSANVYDMTPDQAYAKLIEQKTGTPPVIKLEGVTASVRGTPGQSVTWVTDTAHSYYECTAYLTPAGRAQTSINVGCTDENAPAKFAMVAAIVDEVAGDAVAQVPIAKSLAHVRHRYIELVDSTLDGRAFDHARGRSQVMGWPDPPS
jgi:hypothetical protein